MKRNLKLVSLVLVGLLFTTGCGKIPTLKNGEEAVVTFKDNKKISVDDLYEKVKKDYALMSLESMINTHIYENEFKSKLEEAKKTADSQIEGLISQYGGEEELTNALQQSGIASIDAYKETVYLNTLQTYATKAYAEKQITEDQIKKYYDEESVGDIEVSHILIEVNADVDAKDEDKEKAEKEAKDKVDAIIKELNDAKKENKDIAKLFAEIAKEKSQDKATSKDGGSLGKINYGTLTSAYDELVDAAYDLKDGEYSTKVITTELGYHVILRTKSYDKKSFDDLKDSILEKLADNLIKGDTKLSFTAMNHYRDMYEVDIIDSELNKQYKEYIKNVEKQLNDYLAEQQKQQ